MEPLHDIVMILSSQAPNALQVIDFLCPVIHTGNFQVVSSQFLILTPSIKSSFLKSSLYFLYLSEGPGRKSEDKTPVCHYRYSYLWIMLCSINNSLNSQCKVQVLACHNLASYGYNQCIHGPLGIGRRLVCLVKLKINQPKL